MAQHDYAIDNGPGLTVRDDINAMAAAIRTNNSGPIEPAAKFAGQWWLDTSQTTGPGVIRIRTQQNDAWVKLPTGDEFVSVEGGVVYGDLEVAGIFSNPGYDGLRGTNVGNAAPSDPVPGMQWYDTSVAPPVIRIRNPANNAWNVAQASANPVFQGSVTITAPGNLAELDLIAAGEKRRIVNDAASNWLGFYAPGDALIAAISDSGDMYLSRLGWIVDIINGKQANLGFTPARQIDGNLVQIGYEPGSGRSYIYGNGAFGGYFYTTSYPPPASPSYNPAALVLNSVGSYSVCAPATSIGANGAVSGAYMNASAPRYGAQEGTYYYSGTWRNMSADYWPGSNMLGLRIA